MQVLAILDGDPQTEYGVNTIHFEAVEGEAKTPVGLLVGIDPTLPDRLPAFDAEGTDFARVNCDVYPHEWNADGFVTALFLRFNALHGVLTGNASREMEATIIEREKGSPGTVTQPQWVEPTGLHNVKVEIPLPSGLGTQVVPLMQLLKWEEVGVWHKQAQYFSRLMSPDDGRPICGFQTFLNQYSAWDFVKLQVCPHNDLFRVDNPAGYYEENEGVGGPMYFKRITIRDLPPGWEIVHFNQPPSQGALDLLKEEQAHVDWNDYDGPKRPLADSWHVYAARGTDLFEFGLRRTASCPSSVAQQIIDGAGVSRVVQGELSLKNRGRLQAMGWRDHDVADSFVYQGVNGREGLRKQMQEHWAQTLGKIQTGAKAGGYGERRYGHWHLAGEIVAHQGGAQELIGMVGQYHMREELNALKAELKGKIYRQAVGRHDWLTGDVVKHDDMVAANAGKCPYLQLVNDHDFETWDPNFRADEFALNAHLGNIDPGISRHQSEREIGDRSRMPQNRLHNYPGAGQYVVEPPWSFPFNQNNNAFGPYPGTHDERFTHVIEGAYDYTHERIYVWLAERQAEHVQECYSQYEPDTRGEIEGGSDYYRYEVNLFLCFKSFDENPASPARKYHGGRCEAEFDSPIDGGPRWIHRMWGQFGIGLIMAARMMPPSPRRQQLRAYFNKLVKLAHLRCSKDGFGIRGGKDRYSELAYPVRPINWGISDPVKRDGGLPDGVFSGSQLWFFKYTARLVAAGERILGLNSDFGGPENRPWTRIVIGPIKRNQEIADHYRQKVPAQYTVVASQGAPGEDSNDRPPDGLYGGIGNGHVQEPWNIRRSKASERAVLGAPGPEDFPYSPDYKATLSSQAIEFWAGVAAFGETSPLDVEGIAVLDQIRKVIEGCVEEATGHRVWFTFQQAYEVCFQFIADPAVSIFWWHWDRPRWAQGASYMQNALQILEKHPTWSVEGDNQGRLPAPQNVTTEDTAAGLVVRWDPLPGAATMLIDWGELHTHEGPPDEYISGVPNTGEYTIPVAGLPAGFFVHVRLSGEDLDGRQGTSTGRMTLRVGDRATVSPPPFSTGGGGGTGDQFPGIPILSDLTPVAGGLDLEVTDGEGVQATAVFGVEVKVAGGDWQQVAYQQLSALDQSNAPTYTVPIRGLAPTSTEVRVRARAGNANWSGYSDTLNETPLQGGGPGGSGLPAPENFSATAAGDRITMDWDPVEGAALYFYGEGPTPVPDESWAWHWFGYDPPIPTFAVPPVGQRHYFAVAAHNGQQPGEAGLGDPSDVWFVEMPTTSGPVATGPQPPSVPTFSNPNQGDGQVSIDIS